MAHLKIKILISWHISTEKYCKQMFSKFQYEQSHWNFKICVMHSKLVTKTKKYQRHPFLWTHYSDVILKNAYLNFFNYSLHMFYCLSYQNLVVQLEFIYKRHQIGISDVLSINISSIYAQLWSEIASRLCGNDNTAVNGFIPYLKSLAWYGCVHCFPISRTLCDVNERPPWSCNVLTYAATKQ
jgi:hypothetical protein